MKNFIKQIKSYPLLFTFAVVIFGGMLLDNTATNRAYSELENRSLAQKPKITWNSLISNTFSQNYEKYTNDQFIYRDQWISLKSIGESALGKIENNGIIYGKDHQMFDKLTSVDQERLERNVEGIKTFMNRQKNSQNALMVIPSAYSVLTQLYQAPMISVNQPSAIYSLYNTVYGEQISTIDVYPALLEKKDQYIYYKTDHHWTTLGAYAAYEQFCKEFSLTPIPLEEFDAKEIEDFYGTHYSKAKKIGTPADTMTYYPADTLKIIIDGTEVDDLYDEKALEKRDKYEFYLRGNHGITNILTTPSEEKEKSLLVIKDSYANSLIPFLTYHFEEIDVIDMRHFRGKMSDFMADKGYTHTLITYSFSNLASDVNVPLINH